jgi:hypothetical protein
MLIIAFINQRSTHRQELLRKTSILFTPIKKANAKKVAPAKRGKILVLQNLSSSFYHDQSILAFHYTTVGVILPAHNESVNFFVF